MDYPDLSQAIEMIACSDAGRVRDNNEDAVFANPWLGLMILADGMGGHNAGEVASGMAITVLSSELEHAMNTRFAGVPAEDRADWIRTLLLDMIQRTNAAVHLAARNNPKLLGMGTTLVLGQFHDNRLLAAHVGDSRLYRWREGQLTQLTRDHSWLQEQIDNGMITPEQARFSANKNLVTRALGIETMVNADIAEYPVLPGDIYLACSDGLNDMAGDSEIAAVLTARAEELPYAAAHLIAMANELGGRDNVSVILAKIKHSFPASPAKQCAGARSVHDVG